MIVVALVENEADVACKGSFALVVEEFYLVEEDQKKQGRKFKLRRSQLWKRES